MCGIVGYIGRHQAAPFLIDGLSKLNIAGMIPAVSPFIMTVRSMWKNVWAVLMPCVKTHRP